MKKNGVEVVSISRGKYQVGNCVIEFYRNARYDTFDGKYKPGWIVKTPNGEFIGLNKDHAIDLAIKHQ